TIATISMMLGIAVPEVESLRDLTRLGAEHLRAARLGLTPSPEAVAGRQKMRDLVIGILRSGAYDPEGVMAILAGRLEAGELTESEAIEFAVLLLVAGHSTTTNLIGNAVYVLAERPQDLERLAADEAFAAPFVEEVLRTRGSFQRSLRITKA